MAATAQVPTASAGSARTARRLPGELWLWRGLIVVGLLALLEIAVRTGLVSDLFVAPPSKAIAHAATGVFGGDLLHPLGVTLAEAAAATGVAAVLGLILGYALWRSPVLTRAHEPLVAGLFASPIILLYPIYLVIFGRNSIAIGAQAATLGVLPMILSTRQGLAGVPRPLTDTAIVYRLSRGQALRHVLLPAAAPTIFTGLRLSVTYVLISVVAMEYLAQIGGLGRSINQSYLRFDMVQAYAAMVVVIVVTAILIGATTWLQRVVSR